MPTEDAYSPVHLVLSHFGTCMCSYVETFLSMEHPSVLQFHVKPYLMHNVVGFICTSVYPWDNCSEEY